MTTSEARIYELEKALENVLDLFEEDLEGGYYFFNDTIQRDVSVADCDVETITEAYDTLYKDDYEIEE